MSFHKFVIWDATHCEESYQIWWQTLGANDVIYSEEKNCVLMKNLIVKSIQNFCLRETSREQKVKRGCAHIQDLGLKTPEAPQTSIINI